MRRTLLLVLLLLIAALAVYGCGGGSKGSSNTPRPGEGSPSAAADGTPGAAGTPGADNEIVPPDDLGEFLGRYVDKEITDERCSYDAAAVKVDCGDRGSYTPNPKPPDDEAGCAALIVEEEPIAVRCSSKTPLTVNYYQIAP